MPLHVQKAPTNRRFQHIVEAVEAAIIDGQLQPGDQLPPELELKELFGTGRGTVREALRVLEEKGLIVIRAGATGGAFVREADPAKLTEHLTLLVQAQSIADTHILEFRELIEPEAAALAAGRVRMYGADDLENVLVMARTACADNDQDAFLAADVATHVAIAELTGNPLLTAVLKMVHEHVLDDASGFTLSAGGTLKDNLADLTALTDAVLRGDPATARRRALRHIRTFHGCGAAKGDAS